MFLLTASGSVSDSHLLHENSSRGPLWEIQGSEVKRHYSKLVHELFIAVGVFHITY